MTATGRGKMVWAVGIILGILVLAGAALSIAVRINAPAVLNLIDRVSAPQRAVQLLDQASFGPAPAQRLSVYGPNERSGALPVIVFVHGGGWNSGDPDDYEFVARAIVPEGFIVVTTGYRLHPHAVYPAMLEDTASAIAWTHANIARLGGNPEHMVIAGHSAGAYNAVMTALDTRWLANEGLGAETIAGVIGLAGPYDFYPFTTASARNSFGRAEDPEATQPVNFVRGDAPPMLLMHGEGDRTVKPRNSRALAAALETAGARIEAQYYADFDHSDLVVSLASPWRGRRPVLREIVKFARTVQASVPVQGETR